MARRRASSLSSTACRLAKRWSAATTAARRLVYTVRGGKAEHHNAAAQVLAAGASASRFVWTTDVLPDTLAPYIGEMMDRGAAVMKATLEAA